MTAAVAASLGWRGRARLLLVGLGGPLAYAAASPMYSSGDEAAHVDYALQVWRGALPVFEDGLVLENEVGVRPPVQWTAHHPPLLYLLLAPVVGPLVEQGHLIGAGLAARGVIIALAVALVFASRWMALQLFPDAPRVGIATGVVVGLSLWFIRLGGSVYNDILAALVTTLAFGLLIAVMRNPDARALKLGLVAMVSAAALTRFSLAPIIALLLAALFAHSLLVRRVGLARASALPLASAIAVVLTSGWFYLRNWRLTGSLGGGHPDWAVAHTGRVERPVLEVAIDPGFWSPMLQQFSAPSFAHAPWPQIAVWGTLVLFGLPVLLGVITFVGRVRAHRARGLSVSTDVIAVAVIVCAVGGIAAMQVMHTAGAGSALPRYFFAFVPYLAPLMALGILRLPAGIVVFGAWAGARVTLTAVELAWTLGRDLRPPQADVHQVATWAGFTCLALGAVLAVSALGRVPADRRG